MRRSHSEVAGWCEAAKRDRDHRSLGRIYSPADVRIDGEPRLRLERGIELFWVDERMVPPTDSESNYRMTRESLLDAISMPESRIHRIAGEMSPEDAMTTYIGEIRRVFGIRQDSDELPVFDVIQRGMGPDMHTASLFPGEPLILNQTDIAAAVWVPKMGQHRVTLLPGVLERARQTLYLVSGADKAAGLRSVLREPPNPLQRPAQIASDAMAWYVDELAYGADPAIS